MAEFRGRGLFLVRCCLSVRTKNSESHLVSVAVRGPGNEWPALMNKRSKWWPEEVVITYQHRWTMMTFNKGDQWSKGERLSIVIHYQSELFSWQWVKKKQCKIATALMDLILPNTDNMIFNTSCMHSIPLVFDISFCVSGLAHLHMPLRPPLVSIQELPITLYKLVRMGIWGKKWKF